MELFYDQEESARKRLVAVCRLGLIGVMMVSQRCEILVGVDEVDEAAARHRSSVGHSSAAEPLVQRADARPRQLAREGALINRLLQVGVHPLGTMHRRRRNVDNDELSHIIQTYVHQRLITRLMCKNI